MNRKNLPLLLAVVLSILLSAAGGASATAATGDVVQRFPTPGPCPTGLTYDGHCLWLADRWTGQLYQIDPKDGRTLKTIEAPCYRPEGLTMEGDCLWVLDAGQKAALKFNPQSGVVEKNIELPCNYPQGLAFDGKHLWVADIKRHRLFEFSTEDGTSIRSLPSPAEDPYGLTYDGKYLWVSDRIRNMIYMVCPENGYVIVEFPSPAEYPRGLAFDGKMLWNADYQTDSLYRLKVQDSATYVRPGSPKRETLQFVCECRNYGPGEVTSLDMYMAVPRNLPYQQILGQPTFTPQPQDVLTDKWGQQVAHFHYEDLPAGKCVTARLQANVELYTVRFFLFPEKVGSLAEIPPKIKEAYLANGSKFCIDDPYIKETVRRVVGDESNCYWVARKLFNHVIKSVRYEMVGGWNAAPMVLKRGSGSCSEYSFAYVALCRAAGLPARYVGSLVVRGDDASTDDVFHRWPEVYLPNYGWVPIDPSSGRGMFEFPFKEADVIGYRDNRYLITTISGGPSDYLDWDYNTNVLWKSKGRCKVQMDRFAEWSPLPKTTEPNDEPQETPWEPHRGTSP